MALSFVCVLTSHHQPAGEFAGTLHFIGTAISWTSHIAVIWPGLAGSTAGHSQTVLALIDW